MTTAVKEHEKEEYLLEVVNLKQYFPVRVGFLKTVDLKAVDDVSFYIKKARRSVSSASPAAEKPRSGGRSSACISPPPGKSCSEGRNK